MRESRLFGTAFAAALASLLGLGPGAASGLQAPPEAYQAQQESGSAMPLWLVRYKLRRRGYQDISAASAGPDGFTVLAQDRWGRRVKLYVDGASGEAVPRSGYGLAQLKAADVPAHIAGLGYRCLGPVGASRQHFEVLARMGAQEPVRLHIDPVSGAVWHERS